MSRNEFFRPLLFLHSFIFVSPVYSNSLHNTQWNWEGSNMETIALREFASSSLNLFGRGEINNGTIQGFSSAAALHPYLQKLLLGLGTSEKINQDGDGLLEGVINEDCKGQLIEWSRRFIREINLDVVFDKEKWALHLIDSWGKIPEGILSGHINPMGDFYECVQIKARDIKIIDEEQNSKISRNFEGRYCTTLLLDYQSSMAMISANGAAAEAIKSSTKGKYFSNMTFKNWREDIGANEAVSLLEFITLLFRPNPRGLYVVFPSIGTCFPNSCSQMDVQHILVNIVKEIYSSLELPPELPEESLPWPVTAACYDEKKPDLDAAAIIMITILSVIAALCLAAGIYDYYLHSIKKKQNGSNGNNTNSKPPSVLLQYILAFSLFTNIKKWLNTRKGAEDFGCLHGIRFLSTAWVIIGHTFESFLTVPPWNFIEMKNLWKNVPFMVLLNGTYSVDTFFVLSGSLATYSILKLLDKTKGKLNLPLFYLHRYLRLTPAYAIQIGIIATLTNYLGNGPFWMMNVDWIQGNCRKNWWTNLLYINNVYKILEMCAGQSWYLSNDMQFYILSPFIVWPLWRWELVGLILLGVYTILSIISPVLLVHFQDQAPAMVMTGNIVPFNEIYFRPWARIQTFFVGVWLGWILYKTRGKRLKFNPLVIGGGWLCSTGIALAVLLGIQPWFDPSQGEISEVGGYFYAGLSRFTWGIVISWIIFSCVKGYGGIVNRVLSWKVFMPLGRLSYCVYLTSLQLQQVYHTRFTYAPRYDAFTIVHTFFGHLFMCHCVGFVFMILFESPFIVIQKLIFEGPRRNTPKIKVKEET